MRTKRPGEAALLLLDVAALLQTEKIAYAVSTTIWLTQATQIFVCLA